jgi:uncharacterized protein
MKLIQSPKKNYIYDEYTNNIVEIGEKKALSETNLKEIKKELAEEGILRNSNKVKFRPAPTLEELKKTVNGNMEHIVLSITNQCNFRCRYCIYSGRYQQQRNHENVFMKKETAEKAVEFFFKNNKNKDDLIIGFYGGEPLLNFDVVKAAMGKGVELGKEKNLDFAITTNGYLLNKHIAEILREYNAKIYVSYDGPENIQDNWRRTEDNRGSSKKILENLSRIQATFPDFYKSNIIIQPTITPPYPLNYINKYFLSNPLFKDNLLIPNLVHSIGMKNQYKSNQKDIEKNLEDGLKYFTSCLINGESMKAKIHNHIWMPSLRKIHSRFEQEEEHRVRHNGLCVPSERRIFVSPNGKLRICEKMDSFDAIGDIENGVDFDKVLHYYHTYVRDIEKRCKKCWARNLCDLCFFSATGKIDMDFSVKEEYCAATKRNLLANLTIYLSLFEEDPKILDDLNNILK